MPGGTGPYWAVVLPQSGLNLVPNPSVEYGTVGWGVTGASPGTIGTVPDQQAFGAWAIRYHRNGGTVWPAAPYVGYNVPAAGSYTLSAYVKADRAGSVTLFCVNTSFSNIASRASDIGTTWKRISLRYGESGAVARNLMIQGDTDFGLGTLWIDGVQAESGYLTSYMDGDQDGCTWEGEAHRSRTYRTGDQRTGGTIYPLASLGFTPEETPGIGVAPVVNQLQPYAISDGAEYQRTRYEARPFTLTATFTGTTYADLHTTRRRAFDAIKAGRAPTLAPARLLYWGGGGTVTIDALYSEGMDGAYANVVADPQAVRFVAPDPSWSDELDQGTALSAYNSIGSVFYLAWRDPEGKWGTFNGTLTNVDGVYSILPAPTGTIYVGGAFGSSAGHVARGIARIDAGQLGTLAGGTLNPVSGTTGTVTVLTYSPGGTLFVGGRFTGVNGTTSNHVVRWTGAWGSLTGGTIGASTLIYDFTTDNYGRLWVGGIFTHAGGTTTNGLAWWNGAWGTPTSGAGSGNVFVQALGRYGGGAIAVGGFFSSMGGALTEGASVYSVNETWGSIGGGAAGTVNALAISPSQDLYSISGSQGITGTAYRIRYGAIDQLGSAVTTATLSLPHEAAMLARANGDVLMSPIGSIKPFVPAPVGYAVWNGYSWHNSDLLIVGTAGSVFALAEDALGTLYIGGRFRGDAFGAYRTTIVNRGMSDAYPTLRMRNPLGGTARVYQFLNMTTGDEIYFDFVLSAGEEALLDLRPESLGFTSNVKGTVVGAILGGSNLSTWRLAPGTNIISFFSDTATMRAEMWWRPRHVSADGAADPTI